MLSGFTRDEGKYFVKPSPAKKGISTLIYIHIFSYHLINISRIELYDTIFASGDYIDLYAEMDLLVGLSACPQGDVSIPCGQHVPEELCLPLKMDVFVVDND